MQVKILPHQWEFLNSNKKYCLLSGGIGSGKSFAGSWYAVLKAKDNPKVKGLIGANTYKQLTQSTLAALFGVLMDMGIEFKYNQNKGILSLFDTEILCVSLDNYNSLRGVEIGWFWIDETRDTKEDAFKVLMGRLRDKKCDRLEGRLTSSPSGFDWMYDYFIGDKKTDSFQVIKAKTNDNYHLPDEYAEDLKASYDSKLYAQEVEGEFINITSGRVYYGFEREHNVANAERPEDAPIWIGMDFNINPMSGVIAHVYNNAIYVFDEIWLQTSNTNEVAKYTKDKYGTGHRIIPDATGKALKTSSAGLSDHDILRQHGFQIPHVANPPRVDRYAVVNSLLEKKRIIIHPRCKNLIRDLERVSYKEGTNLPETSDKTLTHISDALGYLAWYHFPIRKPKITVRRYA